PPGGIGEITRLVLVNAIYFKGTWLNQFDPRLTKEGAFWVTPGVSVPAQFMSMKSTTQRYGHAYDSPCDVRLLELPYAGEDLSMVILLPEDDDGLDELEAALTVDQIDHWYGLIREHDLTVVLLPRWTVTSSFDLETALSGLGMPSAFNPLLADFSGMDGRYDLFIDHVRHKAFVQVNEAGTEAAAATEVDMGYTGVLPFFKADHPFLFYIRDNVTGSILFLGRVVDPTAE
ncbi:MAG: serpin family protein, partial [Candidatus Eisenbacteria bacterium]|nr:serpin family protein [Candidatus Eisenbacteria bacterium]